jgi:hypothetical protein
MKENVMENQLTVKSGQKVFDAVSEAGFDYSWGFLRDRDGNVTRAADNLVEAIAEDERCGCPPAYSRQVEIVYPEDLRGGNHG